MNTICLTCNPPSCAIQVRQSNLLGLSSFLGAYLCARFIVCLPLRLILQVWNKVMQSIFDMHWQFQMTWWESWWRSKEKWRRNFQGLNHPKKKSFHSQKTWSSVQSCRSAERSWKCRPRRQLTLPLQNKMIVGAIYHIKIYNLPSCMTGLTKSFTTTYMPTEFHRPMSTVVYSKYLYK